MPKLKNRPGVTLVLTAFMVTALIGAAAFAVDFGRMYMYRTQLSTAADAAALAGVWEVLNKTPTNGLAQAESYASRHLVGTDVVTLDDADVTPGTWTLDFGPFAPLAAWDDPAVDAVRVVARTRTAATQNYTFGRVLGFTSHTVVDTAIAIWGYVGVTTCVRPVAIPYISLLTQLYHDASGNPTVDISYNLTPDDVVRLQNAGPADALPLKLGGGATAGNFYLVNLGPYANPNGVLFSPGPSVAGQPVFSDQFGGDCSHSPWSLGPGDWLQGRTGNADGPTQSGFEELCGGNITGTGTFPCNAPLAKREIKIALWANEDDGFCTPRCFQVKMVGVFVVVSYTKSSSGDDGITGYFSSIPTSGSFTNVPTPITKIGLVK